jgi:hypothetical protein
LRSEFRKLTFLKKAKFLARFIPHIPVYSGYSGFDGYVLFRNILGWNTTPGFGCKTLVSDVKGIIDKGYQQQEDK